MSLKRKLDENGDFSASKTEKEARGNCARPSWNEDQGSDYLGFSFQKSISSSDEQVSIPVENGTISARDFFTKYVATRRPCVIEAATVPSISLEQLNKVAGDKLVQVERRFSTTQAFGQNRTASRQLVMTVSDFLKHLEAKDGNLYYLSTQDTESDNVFQVPCRQLLEHGDIASQVPWAGNLVLHSCNLWMGASRDGSSSGLHHDYHDNFYLLIRGRKRFRLFSPDCAPCMYTHGEIERVYANGLISYVGSETRADGVALCDLPSSEEDGDEEEEEEEEEGVFFGKGFDYKSDSESTHGFDESKDDFEDLIAQDEQAEKEANPAPNKEGDNGSQRPNSFSVIDVDTLQNPARIAEKFPQFASCRECIVELKEGQTLYLPAGWFHEVTSRTVAGGENHTALNYWYHPPDSPNNFEQPYTHHQFWKEQAQNNIS